MSICYHEGKYYSKWVEKYYHDLEYKCEKKKMTAKGKFSPL